MFYVGILLKCIIQIYYDMIVFSSMGEYSNTDTLTINHHNFIISQLNISNFIYMY